MNKEAAVLAKKNIRYDKARVIVADAADTQLPDGFADKVYGEAMLTMCLIHRYSADGYGRVAYYPFACLVDVRTCG